MKSRYTSSTGASLAVIALFVAALAASGCAMPDKVRRTAAVKLAPDSKVMFVPLKEKNAYYYDSVDGIGIAQAAGEALSTNFRELAVVDFNLARGPLRSIILQPAVTDADWTGIGRAAGVDYIVYGTLTAAWKDPGDAVTPRAAFEVAYTVFDVAAGRGIYAGSKAGLYPTRGLSDNGTTVFEMGEAGLHARAQAHIGKALARTFYTSTITKREDGSIKCYGRDIRK